MPTSISQWATYLQVRPFMNAWQATSTDQLTNSWSQDGYEKWYPLEGAHSDDCMLRSWAGTGHQPPFLLLLAGQHSGREPNPTSMGTTDWNWNGLPDKNLPNHGSWPCLRPEPLVDFAVKASEVVNFGFDVGYSGQYLQLLRFPHMAQGPECSYFGPHIMVGYPVIFRAELRD